MPPHSLSLFLLCLSLSSGRCASLAREKNPDEDIPTLETPVEAETVAVAGTPVTAGPRDVEPQVDVASDGEDILAHEVHAEEPNVGSPDSAPRVPTSSHTEALAADNPSMDDTAYMDLKSVVKETLRTEDAAQELSDQEEQAGLPEDVVLRHSILREFAQDALQQDMEELGPEAPVRPAVLDVGVQTEDSSWGLASVRDGLQAANGYFDSLVELMGGRNGVCQYMCKYGKTPVHRHGYTTAEPNGCASDIIGFQLGLGIPAMTLCCAQLDSCYHTCGANKHHCDSTYRRCLHAICADLKESLGFVSKVKACESVADGLYSTVWTLGCPSFMNSQREACYCEGDDRDEL